MYFYLRERHHSKRDGYRATDVETSAGYRDKVLQLLVPMTLHDNVFGVFGVLLGWTRHDDNLALSGQLSLEGPRTVDICGDSP